MLRKTQLHYLMKLLRKRGALREDAEDLVQEAVLRLYVYTQSGGEVQNPEAFVRRVAFNLAVDEYRSAHLDRYVADPVEKLELMDLDPSPDEVLEAEQRLIHMGDALERASCRTREVFFMHRLQGFNHAEIAAKLRISKSAVEKHIASAITILGMERQREQELRER
jgi:RNA polymerase sigma-70 factor (ECF subfamily)